MMKFMKYEIKGTYKYILGVLALVLILTTALHLYGHKDTSSISTLDSIFVFLSVLILFGTAVVTFFYIVGSFKKELSEDRGYLTFTLPLTGNQIVGSKLIVALMWFIILGAIILAYNFIIILILNSFDAQTWTIIKETFSGLGQIISLQEIISMILIPIFSLINLLVLIYFSMALGKVTFRNKKIGGLWFIIFILVSIILSYGQLKVAELIPYYFNVKDMSIGKVVRFGDMLNNEIMFEVNGGVKLEANRGILQMNIVSRIFNILTTIGLFLGTGYLIEKRIDL